MFKDVLSDCCHFLTVNRHFASSGGEIRFYSKDGAQQCNIYCKDIDEAFAELRKTYEITRKKDSLNPPFISYRLKLKHADESTRES